MSDPRVEPRRPSHDESGAVIVEFAAIFIVFAMLLWGLISYGVVFAAQQSLTHAASDAARATVGLSDETEARDNAARIVADQLEWLPDDGVGFDESTDVTFAPCDNAPSQDCVTVWVAYDWAGHPIVPSMLDVATPGTLGGRAVVQWR